MIYKASYVNTNIDTDLNISVDTSNAYAIRIKMNYFKDDIINIQKECDYSILFAADSKYDKIISISLIRSGKVIIDERFDDPFYYETPVSDLVDKICWFTIPTNFSDSNGLNAIDIFAKGV